MYRAVGILESVWLLCQDCCDEGDVGKFSDEEIADYLGWEGDPSELVRGLAGAGWIDSDADHRYIVHDWLNNCPEYIWDRIRKRDQRGDRPAKRLGIKTCAISESETSGDVRPVAGPDQAAPPKPNQTKPNQTKPIDTSGETAGPSSPPALLEFPCDGRKPNWNLTRLHVDGWQKLYPSLDIESQCRSALAWVLASPQRRKTHGGMTRFLVGWFNRSQNSNGHSNGNGKPNGKPTNIEDQDYDHAR